MVSQKKVTCYIIIDYKPLNLFTMIKLNCFPGKKDLLKGFYLFLMVMIGIITFSSCTKTPQPYKIVRYYGNGSIMNYSKELNLMMYNADSSKPAVILQGQGDLILFNEEIFHITDPGLDSLSFSNRSGIGYVNGKINSFGISEKDTAGIALKGLLSKDISSLGMIYFGSSVPRSCIPLLEELAKIKPDISLSFEKPVSGLNAILKLFKPKILFLANLSADVLKDLPGLASPEILIAGFNSTIIEPMPAMPSLKKIIIYGSENEILPNGFFSANTQIENLSVFGIKYFDFALLNPLTMLKELVINEVDSLGNQNLLSNHKSIEMLAVLSQKFSCDSTLDNLGNIRWMTFPPVTRQDEFNRFIEKHPSLEVIEVIKNENLTSLQNLSSLKQLYGLIVSRELPDTVSILSFNKLKYLSLPSEYLKDSLKYELLKRSLPNTIIVPNEGFCLGSGWLLLLIPFVILFRFASGKKRS
jgi:hypothetical protein